MIKYHMHALSGSDYIPILYYLAVSHLTAIVSTDVVVTFMLNFD